MNLFRKKRNRRLRWNRSEILSRTSARARSGEPSRPRSRKISIFEFFNAEHGQSVATARTAPKFYPSNTCLGRSGAFCRPNSRKKHLWMGGRPGPEGQNRQNPHAAAAAAAHDELWSAQTLPPLPPHPGVTYPVPGTLHSDLYRRVLAHLRHTGYPQS